MVELVLNEVAEAIKAGGEDLQIYTSGATNIFRYPELSEGDKASKLIGTLEHKEMLQEFEKNLEKLRLETLLSGEYDKYNAILRLNAGAGGTESCDWCSMLYRMYCRWAEKKGFKVEVLDYLDGDEAGIKSVTIQILSLIHI